MSQVIPEILLVDDGPAALAQLAERLQAGGYVVTAVGNAEKALASLAARRPQLVISDMHLSGMDGAALVAAIQRDDPTLPVIILTALGSIAEAVAAVQQGVFCYLTKPCPPGELEAAVARAVAIGGATPGVAAFGKWRADIVTRNPTMETLLARAHLVAAGDASVLIRGESGTGKDVLAKAIHRASPRRDGPFLAINCGAIPEPLLESELFGHTKGAFTGAVRDHRGLFQDANGGTLLLDEIGDMPLPLQVKLLRVLEERQVRPVGSSAQIPIDVRILSATHRNLEAQIVAGRFREDLYYRLHVVSLTLPPLAERRDDIPLLATHFLRRLAARYGKTINGFAPEALQLLLTGAWPGNVRQLYNAVEQAVALNTTVVVPANLVRHAISAGQEIVPMEEARVRFERDYLCQVLRSTGGSVAQAARVARRNRTDLYKLMQRHGIESAMFRNA